MSRYELVETLTALTSIQAEIIKNQALALELNGIEMPGSDELVKKAYKLKSKIDKEVT